MKTLGLLILLGLAGCTWVTPSPDAQGANILVLYKSALGPCRLLTENQLTVADKLGMLQRVPADVEHDLQTMAINQAASVGANGVSALSDLNGGTQTWGIYKCPPGMQLSASPPPTTVTAPTATTGVKTIPYNPPG